jgi:hypothetical protein
MLWQPIHKQRQLGRNSCAGLRGESGGHKSQDPESTPIPATVVPSHTVDMSASHVSLAFLSLNHLRVANVYEKDETV